LIDDSSLVHSKTDEQGESGVYAIPSALRLAIPRGIREDPRGGGRKRASESGLTGSDRSEAMYRKTIPSSPITLNMPDANRPIPTIRCPDCGFPLQVTVEHLQENRPIVCGGCGRVVTLRGADRTAEARLKEFRAAAEDLDRRTKR
jgi:DNA-directed RNA polymerase subunit RPC12/RpoP